MKRILSKRDARQLKLIELLIQYDTLTLSEVSKLIDVPIRTLSEDIKLINSMIDPNKIITNKQGIYLNVSSNSSIRHIYNMVISNSQEIQLMKYLILSHGKKIDDVAEDNFMSVSTLIRMINTINIYLEDMDMMIDSATRCIVGDEQIITSFYTTLFYELQSTSHQIINQKQLEIIMQLYNKLIEERHIIGVYPDMIRIYIYAYVRLIRIKDHYQYISLETASKTVDFQFLSNNLLKDSFKRVFQLDLDEKIVKEIFNPMFHKNYAHTFDEIDTIIQNLNSSRFLYNNICELIKLISKSLNITKDNIEALIVVLFNKLQFVNYPTYLLYSKELLFTREFIKENSIIASILNKHINSVFPHYSPDLKNEIIYYLVLYWDTLLQKIELNTSNITIGVLLDSTIVHTRFIIHALKNYTKAKINIILFEGENTIKELSKKKEIDLLVTNLSPIQTPIGEVVYINEYPSYNDYKNILAAEERVYKKRLLTSIKNIE